MNLQRSNSVNGSVYSRSVLEQAARFALRVRCCDQLLPEANLSRETLGVVLPSHPDGPPGEAGVRYKPKYDDTSASNILRVQSEIALAPPAEVDVEYLHDLHRRLLEGTSHCPGAPPGVFRSCGVTYGPNDGEHWREAPAMVDALLRWANDPSNDPLPQLKVASGLIKAITVHAELLRIHPYADGNGRLARAVEFAYLVRAGAPLAFAHELHNFYNEDRSAYITRLNDARAGRVDAFLEYALAGLNQRLTDRLGERNLGRRRLLRAAFTLIELVVVIMILGILAGVAAPKLFSTTSTAEEAIERQVVRRIRDGIELYYLDKLSEGNPSFPSALDLTPSNSPCSPQNPCFDKILKLGIRDNKWAKGNPQEYTSPLGNQYVYDPATGEFELTVDNTGIASPST